MQIEIDEIFMRILVKENFLYNHIFRIFYCIIESTFSQFIVLKVYFINVMNHEDSFDPIIIVHMQNINATVFASFNIICA